MNTLTIRISDEILERSSPDKADWWKRYLKGVISFAGTGMPEIRALLLELNREFCFEQLPLNRQVSIVYGLMRGQIAEDKLAAILYMQLFWVGKQKNRLIMGLVSDWFDDRLIYDWNTCDWLSVKVLTPLVDSGDQEIIWALKRWNRDPYLWKARASLVPFAQCQNISSYAKIIRLLSDILIRREERFAKSAVAWVLREYSKVDEDFVLDFLSRHVKHTPTEVKRQALKYYRQKRK